MESLYSQENELRISDISIINKYGEEVEISAKISEDGDTITETKWRVTSGEDTPQAGSIPESDVPTSQGRYHIAANISAESWDAEKDVHTTDFEGDNLTLLWVISNSNEDGTRPTIQLLADQGSVGR
ncbi:hypothetical protein [Halopiger goleimassiliensis]|uniref:hypothetical protein n=1 Tax=Halopiger goleimassiliensis TaxID=1293048 RepID=UPI0012B63861|nr:hypothetical protein [Halopiger goleimassiliensis]